MIRRVLNKVFTRAGWTVREAGSHTEVPAAAAQPPVPDVLILDLTMDGPVPTEYLPGILAAHPSLQVFIATGHFEDDQLTALVDGKRVRSLPKPFTGTEALEAVRSVRESAP